MLNRISWLTKLMRRLTTSLRISPARTRRSTRPRPSAVCGVERLEPRQLLSAAALGNEFRVNTTTAGNQTAYTGSTAIDAAGDYIVTWTSNGQDGSGDGVYAQRYNAAGVAQGIEFRVNTTTVGEQRLSTVAMDAAGDFVITWSSFGQDGSSDGVYAQRYNAAGVAQGVEFRVNTTTLNSQSASTVAMDATGDFVIAWTSSYQDGSGDGVYAQRYNAAGVAQGGEFQVNTTTTLNQHDPAVAMDADGDFVITWADQNSYGVLAQRYNAAGLAQGGESRVNTTPGSTFFPSAQVAMDAAGDFVVTWTGISSQNLNPGIVFVQRFNAAGVAQGGEFQTTMGGDNHSSTVAMDATGNFAVTWTNSGVEIDGQLYNAAGVAQGDKLQVSTAPTGVKYNSTVAMNVNGDFVVDWTNSNQDGSGSGVSAQRYQPQATVRFNGTAIWIAGTELHDTIVANETPMVLDINLNGALSSYDATLISGIVMTGLKGNDQLTLGAGVFQSSTLKGGGGADTLTGGGGNDKLDGDTGFDTYVFNTNTQLNSDTIIDSLGIDLLSFVGSTGAVAVNLGLTTAQIVNANLTLTLASATALENVTGGSGSDMLTGNTLNNTLTGGGGSDSLNGGAGNDTYAFNTSTQLNADTITDSAGIDELSFVGSTNAVAVNLGLTTAQMVNANLTLTLASATALENLTGGSGNDSLTGNTLANSLIGNAGNDSLNGGVGNDTYLYVTNTQLNSDTITDSAGIDELSFAGSTNGVVVNMSLTTAQSVNANLTLTLTSGTALENLTGGSGNDSLSGNSLANTLTGGLGNDSLNGGDGGDTLYGLAGNDSLNGGAGNDTYVFNTNTQLNADNITDSLGIDHLNFSGSTNSVVVALAVTTLQTVNANLMLTLASATALENITGGSGNDSLTGNSLANTLVGGAGNDHLTSGDGADTLHGEVGDDTLAGGGGNDKYVFNTNTPLGSDSITDSTGTDQLFFATSTAALAVNLGLTTAQTVNANLTLTLTSATAFEDIYGGLGNDTLTGNSLNNTLSGGGGNDTLTGGAGNDTYLVDADTALGSDTINEGGGGIDTLDFSATATQAVAVSLSGTAVQVVNANLSLQISVDNSIENLTGGTLNDTLIGNSLTNILSGNGGDDVLSGLAGNDTLIGGAGRNILIGGDGADQLTGGLTEDIMLGAKSTYENDTVALNALRSEWSSASSFSDRQAHLMGTLAGGLNGGFTLTPSTVKEDSIKDTLTGGSGKDWYLRNSFGATAAFHDTVTDADVDSVFTEISSWL